MTFREAALRVLVSADGPLTPDELAEEINSSCLYRKKNGEPIDGRDVVLRMVGYLLHDFDILIGLKNR